MDSTGGGPRVSGLEIRALESLPDEALASLVAESQAEGYRHLERLVTDHASGQNRFDRPGECLLGVFEGPTLVAICGLNHDPFVSGEGTGRVRRLYVAAAHRRQGVGRMLVGAVIERARDHFRRLRLRTPDETAARFYEAMGFRPVMRANKATHTLELRGR
jgi:GNAT superfamily N-acetyltransferase